MMTSAVIAARVAEYAPASVLEQENVLQEVLQQYVLCALGSAGLFAHALFHGGTCLRLIHGMNRFSEDLDFLLKKPDARFAWKPYLAAVRKECRAEGIEFDAIDRANVDTAVRKAFLKTDSIGTLLEVSLPFERLPRRKFRIKLEVDTNPPAGSSFETSYLAFPRLTPLTTQSLPSSFGTKIHALLCRTYVKGRDWYDFQWYAAKGIAPDLHVLASALRQQGPWARRRMRVTPAWCAEQLAARIRDLDWPAVRRDVQRFIPLNEQPALAVWREDYFLTQLGRVMPCSGKKGANWSRHA